MQDDGFANDAARTRGHGEILADELQYAFATGDRDVSQVAGVMRRCGRTAVVHIVRIEVASCGPVVNAAIPCGVRAIAGGVDVHSEIPIGRNARDVHSDFHSVGRFLERRGSLRTAGFIYLRDGLRSCHVDRTTGSTVTAILGKR